MLPQTSGVAMLKLVETFAEGVLPPEDVAILVAAFEDAWDRLMPRLLAGSSGAA